jgi:NAD(P)-dependent dehydrogenase (short-subunit alcohol dehydrogenase family)
MSFDQKVVLISGAAGGIGRASAVKFAEAGALLKLVDRNTAGLKETARLVCDAGASADQYSGDVSDSQFVQTVVNGITEKSGKIDIFHCNAGIQGPLGSIQNLSDEEFDLVMAVNTRSVFLGLKYVLAGMVKQNSGAIVVTCSVASLNGIANLPAYVASKHAALGLVRTAAIDVAAHGVRVNGVCPGAVDTPMLAEILSMVAPDDPRGAASRFAGNAPTGRLVEPDEIADAVLFLSSDAARSITGSYVVIDGGLSAKFGGATRQP